MKFSNYIILLCLSIISIGSLGLNNLQSGYYHQDFNPEPKIQTEEKEQQPKESELKPLEPQTEEEKVGTVTFSGTGIEESQKNILSDYYITVFDGLANLDPRNTTKIGKQKYAKKLSLNGHHAAAYVLARRGNSFKDKLAV